MSKDTPILKLAILNDLIELELTNLDIDYILENDIRCKLKNAKKNSKILTKLFDELMNDLNKSEYFGDLCTHINKLIDQTINVN